MKTEIRELTIWLEHMFEDKTTVFVEKIGLYGSEHPQLPKMFLLKGSVIYQENFWEDHETTHARFITYSSLEDIKSFMSEASKQWLIKTFPCGDINVY